MLTVTIRAKDAEDIVESFEARELYVGRGPENEICLPKGNISKRHCRVSVQDGRVFVVDLGSANGTFVNGKRVLQPCAISETDRVYVGDFTLTFASDSDRTKTDPPPPSPELARLGTRRERLRVLAHRIADELDRA
ncbi:MAG: FHA domain-containing protein [Deltaproteobacteria bacterium]|nr:FHA domain-containing protein [Deltaproteobacteria bacterium]